MEDRNKNMSIHLGKMSISLDSQHAHVDVVPHSLGLDKSALIVIQ